VLFFWGNPSCCWTDSMMSALVNAITFILVSERKMEFIEFVKDTGFGGNCQRILRVRHCDRYVRRHLIK
jgi:hypothetical protein